MSPYTLTSREGPVEEDSDEHEGTSARRGIGTGEEQDASVDRCGEDIGVELPADKETLEAVSRGRSEGSAAPQCGSCDARGSRITKPRMRICKRMAPASRRVLFHPCASL